MIFPVEIWGRSSYQYYSPHQKICKVIDSLVIIIIHMGFFKLDVPVFRSILSIKHIKALCLNFSTILNLQIFLCITKIYMFRFIKVWKSKFITLDKNVQKTVIV